MKKERLECVKEKQKNSWKTRTFKSNEFKKISQGLIFSLPIVIVLILISAVFNLLLGIISPISYLLYAGSGDPGLLTHFITLILLIGLFYLIGLGISSPQGQQFVSSIENEYLTQIPLYSTIRDLVQQFSGIQKMPFSKVVLIDPYDSGVLMTGFITEEVVGEIYTVFVPTAPNPTNGNIYHVPGSRLQFLDVSTEVAMRTVVGMGTGSSCLFPKQMVDKAIEKIPQITDNQPSKKAV